MNRDSLAYVLRALAVVAHLVETMREGPARSRLESHLHACLVTDAAARAAAMDSLADALCATADAFERDALSRGPASAAGVWDTLESTGCLRVAAWGVAGSPGGWLVTRHHDVVTAARACAAGSDDVADVARALAADPVRRGALGRYYPLAIAFARTSSAVAPGAVRFVVGESVGAEVSP